MNNLLRVIVRIIVIGLICYILWWLVGYIHMADPFDKVAKIIVAVVGVVALIRELLQLDPGPSGPSGPL